MNCTETARQWAEQRELSVDYQSETASTNDTAKAQAFEDEEFKLYLADHQTAGRGRGANTWLDTGAGESLLSTWSVAVNSPPQAITAPRIGLALFQASARTWPSLNWSLKAPNDIYLQGLKVAGLLVESVTSGAQHRLIVGLGLNVTNHPRRFGTATNVAAALGRPPEDGEWFQFLEEWKKQLLAAVPECLKAQLTPHVCLDLKAALNANSARTFAVEKVSPDGDLVHAKGIVKWTEI